MEYIIKCIRDMGYGITDYPQDWRTTNVSQEAEIHDIRHILYDG